MNKLNAEEENMQVSSNISCALRWIISKLDSQFCKSSIYLYCGIMHIQSKSWIRWIPESADNLEFSAERLSENAKNINSAIC